MVLCERNKRSTELLYQTPGIIFTHRTKKNFPYKISHVCESKPEWVSIIQQTGLASQRLAIALPLRAGNEMQLLRHVASCMYCMFILKRVWSRSLTVGFTPVSMTKCCTVRFFSHIVIRYAIWTAILSAYFRKSCQCLIMFVTSPLSILIITPGIQAQDHRLYIFLLQKSHESVLIELARFV